VTDDTNVAKTFGALVAREALDKLTFVNAAADGLTE
jgi:hypothetical protein